MKKILVTGGAGFIGSHLVDRLVKDGRSVVVLDNFDPQVHQGKKPDYLNKDAEYIEGDIRDERGLKRVFNGARVFGGTRGKEQGRGAISGVDTIFHLAAKVGVGQSMYEIKEYVEVNTYGTAFLWDYIINNKIPIKKFVVASSMSIYGEGSYKCSKCGIQAPYLRDEEDLKKKRWEIGCPQCGEVLKPINTFEDKKLLSTSVYAITKKDQEELSLNIGTSYKIPTVALRFFNVYGPRQSLSNPYTGACAIFSSRIKNNNPPLIYEDGMQTRDFVYVTDIADACVLAMNSDKCSGDYFNVGTGRAVTINEVAETLVKLYGKNFPLNVTSRYRVGDIRHCYADVTKLKNAGYMPKVNLKDGLKELVEWGRTAEAKDMTAKADLELERRHLTL